MVSLNEEYDPSWDLVEKIDCSNLVDLHEIIPKSCALAVLIEDDSILDQYFECGQCSNVLYEPLECINCQKAYCKTCLIKFNTYKKGVGPCGCPNGFSELHRFVKTKLKAIRFFCPQQECEFSQKNQMGQLEDKSFDKLDKALVASL